MLCVSILAGIAAAPSTADCSNEAFAGFGAFLAACGGYEQVTPDFKAGVQVNPEAISSDGSRLVGESIGVFAGLEGDSVLGYYEITRSDSGWGASAISPPSRLFPAHEFLDVSNPHSDQSMWAARRSSESVVAENLVLRKADDSFVEVGPMIPPEAAAGPPAGEYQVFVDSFDLTYAGASRDLSHVLFQIKGNGPLWPGDTTARTISNRSLYEYVGTGNVQPALVGVDDEGQLISDCGTALGSSISGTFKYNADTYNAVSSDGQTVFFTAIGGCGEPTPAVNEVYARVAPGVNGHTAAISEPPSSDCAACQIEPGKQKPAEFQGASLDGSKVVFLTEQELFKEDTGMNLYEYDFGNRPGHKVLRVSTGSKTPEVQGVVRVSEDGSHVYFVAKAALTEGPNAEGDEPVTGGENLYLFERDAVHPSGSVTFVATLSEADGRDWNLLDERPAQATPNGRFLVFQSVADLTNGDASVVPQVFEYDAARKELVRVSVGESGYPAGMESAETNGASITVQVYSEALRARTPGVQSAVSDDGTVVEFQSLGGLTRQARGAGEVGRESVYEYRSAGPLSNGDVYSVSTGSSQFDALAMGTDASGANVFFKTAAPILESDSDTQMDLYDARENGGFPVLPPVVSCTKEEGGCRGAGAVVPRAGEAGSVVALAGGNFSSAPASAKPQLIARTQKLTKALKACRGKPRRKRRACEEQARKRYATATAKSGRGSR